MIEELNKKVKAAMDWITVNESIIAAYHNPYSPLFQSPHIDYYDLIKKVDNSYAAYDYAVAALKMERIYCGTH